MSRRRIICKLLTTRAISYIIRKRLRRMPAATVFVSSIAEHAQRAFGGTYNQKKNVFLFFGRLCEHPFLLYESLFCPPLNSRVVCAPKGTIKPPLSVRMRRFCICYAVLFLQHSACKVCEPGFFILKLD